MSSDSSSHAAGAVRILEEDILNGRLLPGERLDERKLALRFGVSRTPVREALQRLAANGVVSLAPRQGASVIELDVPDLLDAFEVVGELEALAAAQAARRIQPDQREALVEANRDAAVCARGGDGEAFSTANSCFHDIIIAASQNRILQAQLRTAQLLTAPYRRQVTYLPGRMIDSIAEHEAIVDAILSNEPRAASDCMRRHVNHLAVSAGDFLHYLRANPLGRPPSGKPASIPAE